MKTSDIFNRNLKSGSGLFTLLVVFLFTMSGTFAQPPQKMSYQCVVRNSSGALVTSQNVGVRISLLQGSATGAVVYRETYAPTPLTNDNGLLSLEIGSGTADIGTFSTINWAAGLYYLKTETDPAGGSDYTITGTSQLLSVPYALYAKDVQNNSDADADPSNEIQTLSKSGSTITLSNGGGSVTDAVDDADNNATNEIQTLSLAGNSLSISGGNSVTLQATGDNWGSQTVATEPTLAGAGTATNLLKIAQQGATAEQVLKWNGVTWKPADDLTGSGGLTLPYDGIISNILPAFKITNSNGNAVAGNATSSSGYSAGISGISSSTTGSGVFGRTTALTGESYGINGESASSSGIGVFGYALNDVGNNCGIKGKTRSPNGYSGYFEGGRFYIQGNTGIGSSDPGAKLEVAGQVKITGGSPGAGKVLTSDASGLAVWETPSTGITTETDPTWGGENNETGAIGRTGNVGIGTTAPLALLHTEGTGAGKGNVLFVGESKDSPGDPPVSGAGTRMMWYPDKAAFRAGRVGSNEWDKDYIGFNSTAMGVFNTASGGASTAMGQYTTASGGSSTSMGSFTNASGQGSTAMGAHNTASGEGSTVMGAHNTASGGYSTSMGYSSTASGQGSTAMGVYTTASGWYSTALGLYTKAPSYAENVIGCYNSDYTPASATSFDMNDRLFVVGNGIPSFRRNAVTVLKNGNTGIGTDKPEELLHINNTSGSAKIRISSSATTLAELMFTSGSTYQGAIGFDNANGYLFLYEDGNVCIRNGRIGIQTVTNPVYAVELPNTTTTGTGRGRAFAWDTYSDGRLKSHRQSLPYGIDDIMKLQPISYFHHNTFDDGGKIGISGSGAYSIGFVAQDVYPVIPEIVTVPDDENSNLWSLNYAKMTPVLVKAIQEQQDIIEKLKQKNSYLEAENREITARLERIEAIMGIHAEK